jgi:hypothetical protein
MVIDNDLGWKDIVAKCRQIDKKEIKAGVLEGAGNYKGGIGVAEVATYNHYGTSKIPSRPFLAIACDTNKGWQKWVASEVGKMMDSPANSVNNGLEAIGTIMKGDIKKVIGSHQLAPNAPKTVAIKGHSMPLIGLTYKLMDSIDYEVK